MAKKVCFVLGAGGARGIAHIGFLQAMEENGVIKLENELLSVSYVAEYEKETLDTAKLKKELPEIYDGYIKMSKVKASVRIKAK
jgi:hypothetical protein